MQRAKGVAVNVDGRTLNVSGEAHGHQGTCVMSGDARAVLSRDAGDRSALGLRYSSERILEDGQQRLFARRFVTQQPTDQLLGIGSLCGSRSRIILTKDILTPNQSLSRRRSVRASNR